MSTIPNAFTPNNDGINDGFQVVISDVVYFEINIFNSWGEEVYYSKIPMKFGWAMSREAITMRPPDCTTTACAGRGHVPTPRSCRAPLS